MDAYHYNVPQLFSKTVRRYADRPAIRFSASTAISYQKLNEISNQTARFLVAKGVRPGDRVCICLEKTLVPYAVILGALKAGAVYFAIDPHSPAQRNARILEQCEPKVVFSDRDFDIDGYADDVVPCDHWLDDFPPVRSFDAGEIDCGELNGSCPAYVMFTSGSTGTPKGAVISHGNLVNFAHWARVEYGFSPEDRHTHVNPIYFDNSVFDMYSTFLSGGCLVPFGSRILTDPAALVERIEELECTVFFSVPSLLMYLQVMKEIRREPLRSLRKIVFGGEGYPKVKLKALYDELKGQTELINVYGPTECTCICSSYTIFDEDFEDMEGLPPLGRLIPNFRGYLLDGDNEAVPGEPAELCLGGPCVGLGYYRQKEQTEKAFVQSPLNGQYNETIYRTGDLVRRDQDDGKLYFVGRKDLQIKHQGYRIELEEIQHALVSLDGIDEAVSLHQEDGDQGRIIAVVATKTRHDWRDIKKQVATHLPHYMVPQKIHVVEKMPKNANGKTDRQRLKQEYAGGSMEWERI